MDTNRMKVLIEQREQTVTLLAKIDAELRTIIEGQPRQKRTWTRKKVEGADTNASAQIGG